MKLKSNTYELNRLYHGTDKDRRALNADDYLTMHHVLVLALSYNALLHADFNKTYYPTENLKAGADTSHQFLMPKNIAIQLREIPDEGILYMDVTRTSLFQPRYVNDIVKILDGEKMDVPSRNFNPTGTLVRYLRQ